MTNGVEVSAFERLCMTCRHLLPHPLYEELIHTEDGPTFRVVFEAKDEGPTCRAGLIPLTKDGQDCPYHERSEG